MVGFGGTGSFAFTFGVVFGGVLSGGSCDTMSDTELTNLRAGSIGWVRRSATFGDVGTDVDTLGPPQRYIFRILAPLTATLAIMGWFIFPDERQIAATERKPSLDFAGAGLGTV